MAKDQFSFDIVSEVDLQEVRNAVDQAAREISQRFDFKGTGTSVSLENEKIEMAAGTEDRLKAAWQVLQEKAVRRQVPLEVAAARRDPAGRQGHGPAVDRRDPGDPGREGEADLQVRPEQRPEGADPDPGVAGARVREDEGRPPVGDPAVKEEDFGLALQFTNYR